MSSNIQKVYTDSDHHISLRNQLVDELFESDGIQEPGVLRAMADVPRHWFVPEDLQEKAYENIPLPIGYGQTISQPFIVARCAELLRLRGSERVLEIGGGSGYQAAVLACMSAEVVTIEQSPELYARATEVITKLGSDNLRILHGDGKQGWPDGAPYDRILISCAALDCEPAWERQLRPGGLLVFPRQVGKDQWLERWIRGKEGWFARERVLPVKFVPLL